MVGVNPETAHEAMAGLSFSAAVGQALWAGKLFHVDLNAQNGPRYDQDFRFGAEDLKEAFLTVRLLERAGYDGPRHFDARAYRSEDDADVYAAFARGCIRNYKILAAKAAAFDADPRDPARPAARAGAGELAQPTPAYSADALAAIRAEDFIGAAREPRRPPPRARRPADARADPRRVMAAAERARRRRRLRDALGARRRRRAPTTARCSARPSTSTCTA